jgi:hypothetical protein
LARFLVGYLLERELSANCGSDLRRHFGEAQRFWPHDRQRFFVVLTRGNASIATAAMSSE